MSIRGGVILSESFRKLVSWGADLVVIDSLNFGMILEGLNPNEMMDSQIFIQNFCLPFKFSGACVLLVDHLSKAGIESGGRGLAFGSVQKYNSLDAQINIKKIAPVAPGKKGELKLYRGKDNHGSLESLCNEDEELARVLIDSTGKFIKYSIEPPQSNNTSSRVAGTDDKASEAKSFVLSQVKLEGDWEHTLTSLQRVRPDSLSERAIARAVRDLVQNGDVLKESRKRRSTNRTCEVLGIPSSAAVDNPKESVLLPTNEIDEQAELF